MGTRVWRRCSEDLELGNWVSIRTMNEHVHSPVLSQQGWKATRLLGTRGIVSYRAWPATTGRCLSRPARRRRAHGRAASGRARIEEPRPASMFAVCTTSFVRGFTRGATALGHGQHVGSPRRELCAIRRAVVGFGVNQLGLPRTARAYAMRSRLIPVFTLSPFFFRLIRRIRGSRTAFWRCVERVRCGRSDRGPAPYSA